jgi:hypothetical protein
MISPFFKEAPTDTRMFRCPSCDRIISLGTSTCRYCGLTIDEETARRLNEAFKRVTDAVASANTFKQSIWLAVFISVAGPLYLLLPGQPNPRVFLISLAPVLFLGYAVSWHYKYGKLSTQDRDYPEAVSAMRRSLLVWSAALVIQIAVVCYGLTSTVFQR